MYLIIVINITVVVWIIMAVLAIQTRKETRTWKNAHKVKGTVTGYWEKFGQKVGVEIMLDIGETKEKCSLFVKDRERLSKINIGDNLEVAYVKFNTASNRLGMDQSNVTQLRFPEDCLKTDAKKIYIALIAIAIIIPAIFLIIYLQNYV